MTTSHPTHMLRDPDSYKLTHHSVYKKNVLNTQSYIESRGGDFSYSVFFGLEKWKQDIQPYNAEILEQAREMAMQHFSVDPAHPEQSPFNEEGFRYILDNYGGLPPVYIESVPEGTVVPAHNAVLSMWLPQDVAKIRWVPSFIETSLLRSIWYPSTVATLAREYRKIILKHLMVSGTPDTVVGRFHDFGPRGATSAESAGIAGLANLVINEGTDSIASLWDGRDYYGEPCVGKSVCATEHSVSEQYGEYEEMEYIDSCINRWGGPGRVYSVVADTYDVFSFAKKVCLRKDAIIAKGGVFVIRPDSGDPLEVLPRLLQIIWESGFAGGVNDKGYRVLDNHIRVLQGDGVNLNSIDAILTTLEAAGWSADNVNFGCGGKLYQSVTRDTGKWAMKESAVLYDVEGAKRWFGVSKHPITDSGKTSKKGRLGLYDVDGTVKTLDTLMDPDDFPKRAKPLFIPQYCNGKNLHTSKWADIRKRATL